MPQEPKKHVSHWIAWSVIALAVGLVGFGTWWYYDEIANIYDSTISVTVKPSNKTTTPAATTATPAATSATADWKTYTNTKYGYSIKIPKDYGELSTIDSSYSPTISLDSDLVNFGDQQVSKDGNSFSINANSGNNIDTTIKEYQAKDGVTVADVKIGKNQDILAKKVVSSQGNLRFKEAYLITHNNNTYEIEDTKIGKSIIGNMLSTFQFTK